MSFRTRSTRRHSLDSRRDVNCGGRLHNLHLFTGQRQARGQELIEFAIVVVLLLTVAFGVLDLGRLFHALITIHGAAREGARYAVLYGIDRDEDPFDPYEADIIQVTREEAQNSGVDLSSSSVAVNCPAPGHGGTCGRNVPIRVTVSYEFDLILGGFLPTSSLKLERYVEMLVP